jgi:putative Holliday junction resolvase
MRLNCIKEDARLGTGVLMAFDYGIRRVGVAVGDCSLKMAHPVDTIEYSDSKDLYVKLGRHYAEWLPVGFVVGLPSNEGKGKRKLREQIRRFASDLENKFSLPVYFIEEDYSSTYAEQVLSEVVSNWKKRKSLLDGFSAKIILDAFFNSKG